jgi:hypothetical protein
MADQVEEVVDVDPYVDRGMAREIEDQGVVEPAGGANRGAGVQREGSGSEQRGEEPSREE